MTAPSVSLVVVTYNHERFVDQCLASVSGQTFDDFELVIVDDCSSDRTVERIERWIRSSTVDARLLVNENNRGICASKNRALRHCRGAFISSLSGDDFYEPQKIESQHECFRTLDGPVAAVFSNMRIVDAQGRPLGLRFSSEGPPAQGRIFGRLIVGNFVGSPSVMIRRSCLTEVGPYDETLSYDDYDMWLRLAARYQFHYLPAVLVNYRILRTSLARNPAYAAERHATRARVLLKWYGTNPSLDDVIMERAWKNGRRALAADRRTGRSVLRAVYDVRPSLGRRTGVALSRIPGATWALAATFAVADRLRRAVRPSRTPGTL